MNADPLVSIVTPSYNQASFLEATLQSVLRQEYPQLEYIVVDGGSSDGSPEIIQRYAEQLTWWVSEPDEGQADAINKGFKKARGEIVAWINSDDLYLPDAVREAVQVLQDHPQAGLVYGNAVSADDQGELLNHLTFDHWDLKDFLRFRMICQPAVFMRREILERVGYLDPSYHFLLDHQLWIRMAREADVVYADRTWAVSRYHEEAKNVYMAEQCGKEAYRIIRWAETQRDLQLIFQERGREVWGGAHKLNAHYLLDGGKPAQAFRVYLKAFRAWPKLFREAWQRFLFSGLSVLGGRFLGRWYYAWKRTQKPDLSDERSLNGWPGLAIPPDVDGVQENRHD
jgi:glycosyltransferase involved in cell wall biosynthesis